jgi:lipopolysaccharide transport protein LptA
MKTFWLILAAAPMLALNAQTNLPAPEFSTATNAAAVDTSTNKPVLERPPLHINSDVGYFDLKNRVFVYTNRVVVTDLHSMKLTCEVLTVEAPQMKDGKFYQATADGNVVMDFVDEKGQNNHATADKAVYTDSITNWISGSITNSTTNNIVILTGNPVVTNMQGTIRGDPIIWDRIQQTVFAKNQETDVHLTGTNGPNFLPNSGPAKTNSPHAKPGGTAK